jgi:hypothetical protein
MRARSWGIPAVLLLWGLLGGGPVRAEDPFDIEKDKKRIGEDGDFNFDEVEGKLSLRFYDAVTGKPISSARVTLGEESGETDAGGLVSFPFPRLGREEGNLDVLFEKKGYVRSVVKVHVILDSVFIHRYSISPTLPSGRYRITLDWAGKPPDLDAHLVKAGRYHISFRDMKKFEDQAWLDRDDMDGEGPETITISRLDTGGRYAFYIHDYTHRGDAGFSKFAESRAHVMVFNDAGVVQSFEVPDGAGRVWKVFEIVDGQIQPGSKILDRIP